MKQPPMRTRRDRSGTTPLYLSRANGSAALPSPGAWTLPSGQALADFALRSGFLAPHMLRSGGPESSSSLRSSWSVER